MNFSTPDKLLNFLLSTDIVYQEILELSQSLVHEIKNLHKKSDGTLYPSDITQCILECYRIKKGYSSNVWIFSKILNQNDIKEDESPVVFSRMISQGTLVNYELYNSEQIVNNKLEIVELKQLNSIEQKKQSNTKNVMKSDEKEIKLLILSCINDFDGQYGKTGLTKILKGSSSIKENDYNTSSLGSEYFGKLNYMTGNEIKEVIDELIEEKFVCVKKIMYGRPILYINPDIKNSIKFNVQKEIEPEENDDENIVKILNLINEGKNIFITGHAGTGKSYILNKLKSRLGKKLTITSTTGIAAVNVKGQTIHSWAGVGICNKSVEATVEKILKRTSIKNSILKCKILAIDEVSMLDIRTFEYIDSVLRVIREKEVPFGGIQVIVIGDFFQLPPVEKDNSDERKYCFESELWNDFEFETVQLTKNYRQNEETLIHALSNMRVNKLTSEDIELLYQRECIESYELSDVLHIFATNYEAERYNNLKFSEIDSKEYKLFAQDGVMKNKKFTEEVSTERDVNILKRIDVVCNAEREIDLKIGVRVMLLINLDFDKGLINGSCGYVEEIGNDYVIVHFDNGQVSSIERHDFEFYNNEVLIAMRKQFPLRLAYGITIHKSQGMSLDKLVVDCSRIFEKGQAYVALSRIKTLNGLYLHNFDPQKVMVDEKVVDFYKSI